MKDDVKLYRWPLSQHKMYVTREAMLLKLSCAGLALAVIFGAGIFWITLHEPRAGDSSRGAQAGVENRLGIEFIRHCCLKDVRSAQEALTGLSVEAQKLRVRLSVAPNKDQSTQRTLAVLTVLTDQPKSLWDQLESLVTDPKDNKRRQIRDIRINMEGLTEQYQAAESCCGAPYGQFPPLMKEYLQIAACRFGQVRLAVETNTHETNADK
jgi:hypothetical protein